MDGVLLQQMINGLALGLVYGLITIGYAMIYGIISTINFTHDEAYMIPAYLSAITFALLVFFGLQNLPLLILSTLLFTVPATCTYGWAAERIAYKSLRNSTRLTPLTSTISMSLTSQNHVQVAQGPCQQGIPTLLDGTLRLHVGDGLVQLIYTKLFILIASLISMAVLTYVIRYIKLGRMCRTTQQDRKMASILGTNIDRVISYVFVTDTVMAVLAGMLITMDYDTFDFYAGFIIDIKASTAAIFGGIGSLPGAMLGGLVLGVVETQFSGIVSTGYKGVFVFSLLVLALALRPRGLLGHPQIVKM